MTAIDRLLQGNALSGSDGLTGYLSLFATNGTLYGINSTATPYVIGPQAGGGGSVTSVTVLAPIPGLSVAGNNITTSGTITITGTLTPGGGGTGIGAYTAGDLLYATAAQTLAKLAIGANDTILNSNGSAPFWGTLPSAALPVVPISKGGTGQTTATAAFDALAPTTTAGDLIYSNGTDNVRLGIGTAGQVLKVNGGATAPEWDDESGGSGLLDFNGFRLTPTTATPVVASNVTNATSIYLTPYLHNLISLYNGSSAWETLASAEITISLSGLTADTNYDVFVYNNAGTVTVDTLTAWTNATTRATALVRQDGRLVKSGATTRRYVGTIRISAVTGELDWIPQPSAAAGSLSIWNMQNRVLMPFRVFEATDNWSYGTASWRQANASGNNQMNVVVGLAESEIDIELIVNAVPVTNNAAAAIGEDSTSARATENVGILVSALQLSNTIKFNKIVPVGYHFYAWLEYGNGGTVTWYGDFAIPDTFQSGFQGKIAC